MPRDRPRSCDEDLHIHQSVQASAFARREASAQASGWTAAWVSASTTTSKRCGSPVAIVTAEALRQWGRPFGHASAPQRRHRRPQPGDQGPLDEGCLLHAARHSLWRAVDQAGAGLDILGQRRRHKAAAKQLFRTRLQGQRRPAADHHGPPQPRWRGDAGTTPGVDHRGPAISTTARRTRIRRRANGSGACRGLTHPDRPSDASPPMVPWPHTFALGVTSARPRIASRAAAKIPAVGRSPARS